MKILRPLYAREGFKSARYIRAVPDGRWVKVVGIVTIRQRPGTASGVVFSTIEDETGAIQNRGNGRSVNLVGFPLTRCEGTLATIR